MSRNCGTAGCYACDGRLRVDGAAQSFTALFPASSMRGEYGGHDFVPLVCEDCEAKFLGWVTRNTGAGEAEDGGITWYDVSWRSSFNDEPGPDDIPKWDVETVRRRKGPYTGFYLDYRDGHE